MGDAACLLEGATEAICQLFESAASRPHQVNHVLTGTRRWPMRPASRVNITQR